MDALDGLLRGLTHRVAAALTDDLATPGQLRHRAWTHPLHGLVRPTGADPGQPLARIHDAVAVGGPRGVLGGWACAFVSGVTVLDGIDWRGAEQPVLIFTPDTQLRPRSGLEPSRMRLRADEVVDLDGLRVTTLARALYDEMLRAGSVREALAVLDAGTSRVSRGARTGRDSVRDLVARHKKTRGIVRVRAAVELGSERVASRGESRLRHTGLEAGAGPFLVNAPVFDTSGRLVGIVDLLDEEAGLVLEYDGADHRQPKRHSDDNSREEDLEDLNLTVVRATSYDATRLVALDRRIRVGRRRGLSRQRRYDRWSTVPPAWWYGSQLAQTWGYPPWR